MLTNCGTWSRCGMADNDIGQIDPLAVSTFVGVVFLFALSVVVMV